MEIYLRGRTNLTQAIGPGLKENSSQVKFKMSESIKIGFF